jgi:anaerobic magnesium-protoporphyrin IX monomethyl ester cyclase
VLILLTHANHIYSDRKQVRKMQPYPPLQTLIAAAVLRAEGHQVALFDCTFDRNFAAAIDEHHPDLVAVCEDNFNFLTKMCLLENRELAFAIAKAARDRGIRTVVNSSDATGNAPAYLAAGFDRVIPGELEEPLVETCRAWPGSPVVSQRKPLSNLDALPMPAWDLIDMDAYRRAWTETHGYFSLNLSASRGCPYHCNWCAKPMHGDAYRTQSPQRVAAEIAEVRERFAPDQIWFTDDIFGLSARWTREFAACVRKAVPFRIQSRCDLMTRDTVQALASAGCMEVWMGAESGSQRVLDAMEKGIRAEHVAQACDNLRRHGIRACLFLQFGYLGEEWDDIQRTIDMVRDVRPDDIGVSVSYPLPGTRFLKIVQARTAEQELGGRAHWRESGDLDMLFAGPFPTEMYRALSDALHLEVRGGSPHVIREAWDKVEQLRCACC